MIIAVLPPLSHFGTNNINPPPTLFMDLIKRDPLYVVVEAEEKELFHSIIDIERRIQDINASIKGLIDHKVFLEHELQVKKRKQDDCRRKKEHSSKVCNTLSMYRMHSITHHHSSLYKVG